MKAISLLILSLSLLLFACSSNRSTAIPTAITDLSAALNTRDQDGFKRLIWSGAADYGTIQSGATQVSNLVVSGVFNYKYYFSNAEVPTTTAPLNVPVECVVLSYIGTTLVSQTNYSRSSGLAKFEFVNSGTAFAEEWKISKIYLPTNAEPVVKAPRFMVFTGP